MGRKTKRQRPAREDDEDRLPRKKQRVLKGKSRMSPRPSNQWPTIDWSQLPRRDAIQKTISTGNWDYLRSEATRLYSSAQQTPCSIDLSRFVSGRQNVVFEIAFSNGTYWILRVSLTEDVETQMLSEVATMKLLLKKTSIPVPMVFGFNCHHENPFGFPYIFMSAIPGRHLDKTFALSVPDKHKPKVAGQLARYWSELSQIAFDQIGRICGGLEADDEPHIVSLPWFGAHDSEPGFYDIGPFRAFTAYLSGIRRGMDDLLRAHHQDSWSQWSKPCRALTDAIPSLIIAPRHRRGPFPLAHPDFHYGNVLLDDDYKTVRRKKQKRISGTGSWSPVPGSPPALDPSCPLPLCVAPPSATRGLS